jgi:two-component system cell cycle response regulator CtrA
MSHLISGLKAQIAVLEKENDDLRERVAFLESELGTDTEVPLCFCLTPREALLFGALYKNTRVTTQMAMASLYHLYSDGDLPEPKIIDVFICKMRKKLKPFGIKIKTIWGQGYFMSEDSKATAHRYMQD